MVVNGDDEGSGGHQVLEWVEKILKRGKLVQSRKRIIRRNVVKYLDIFYWLGIYFEQFGIDETSKFFFF